MRAPDSPPEYSSYLLLMRLHQPTGIWLLLWPCWWAVTLASPGFPSLATLALFFLGAFIMRPAGCIVNDIADRTLDAQVERTKARPIASGDITVPEAMRLLLWLLLLAFGIAWLLGKEVVFLAVLSLPLIFLYPRMKRISWWPQLFLGLTFNWGALMGWAAVRGTVELPALLLYIGGVFWTLGYDTIYAHQDKADDARAGIKSTALRLGDNTKPALYAFYTLAVLCWGAAHYALTPSMSFFYVFLFMAWLHFLWQVRTVNLDDPASCQRVFVSNSLLGWIMLAAGLVGK